MTNLQKEVDGTVTWSRISNLIGSPIQQEEAMLCQETFNNLDQCDFIQLPVTTGRDLWSVMYGAVSGNDGTARELFQ
jgi:hypothetical protein